VGFTPNKPPTDHEFTGGMLSSLDDAMTGPFDLYPYGLRRLFQEDSQASLIFSYEFQDDRGKQLFALHLSLPHHLYNGICRSNTQTAEVVAFYLGSVCTRLRYESHRHPPGRTSPEVISVYPFGEGIP
jgi:hypothetical protein